MSALELDYSDELSAELSDRRILNRLYELQGLFSGVSRATELVAEIAQAREGMLADKMRGLKLPKSDSPDEPKSDFRYEVLRAIQERFGLYDPNNPTDVTDRFDPDSNLRVALGENLQFQMGSDTLSSRNQALPPPRTGLSSTQPIIDNYGQGAGRIISSGQAVVRELENRDEAKRDRDEAKKDRDKDKTDDPDDRRSGRFRR
jgi:hypothetical protein